MNNQTSTLADFAVTHPGATRVFLKHGLDFCCRGRRPLAEACGEVGLDPETILAEIAEEEEADGDNSMELASKPVSEIVDFIEGHYHQRLRAELPELIAMAEKVEKVHAGKPACPRALALHLRTMHSAILEHLAKEEQVLFPMIRNGTHAQTGGPIRIIEQEHEDHGKDLAALRELAQGFLPPAHACTTWRALYLRLSHMSDELMEHIHIENNVLFPRALCE